MDWEIVADSYKREALSLNEENKELKKKVEQYEKALGFYANEENYEAWDEYEDATGYFNNVDFDSGDKAKNVLGK